MRLAGKGESVDLEGLAVYCFVVLVIVVVVCAILRRDTRGAGLSPQTGCPLSLLKSWTVVVDYAVVSCPAGDWSGRGHVIDIAFEVIGDFLVREGKFESRREKREKKFGLVLETWDQVVAKWNAARDVLYIVFVHS